MTNSYSFIDIFNRNIEVENGEKIKLNEVIIPIIQRDYAQGRRDIETTRIRKRFLLAIHDALDGNPITLDFIYGDIDKNGRMTPLDGQQRLTTLFLLHWYAAKRENISKEEYDFLYKFGYETRYSAVYFCKYLVDFNPEFNNNKISEEIINQSWFPLDWLNDQTINSMLVVLDNINDLFNDITNIWEKLNSNLITFYFLPIKDMGLTDELYIKMNSRGKPLTMFENFKAELEHSLNEWNSVRAEQIIRKIDREWTDCLWKYKNIENTIDDEFLNYFKFICDIICYKKGESPLYRNEDEFDLIKKYFSVDSENLESNVKLLEDYFDCWSNVSICESIDMFFEKYLSKKHEIGKTKIENRIDIFKDCLNNYGSRQFSIGNTLRLYAFISYLTNKENVRENEFRRRFRIINNLINNSEYEMSASTTRAGGLKIPAMLMQIDNIIVKGIIEDDNEKIKSNFNANQIEEEKQKLEWTKLNPEKMELLFELEDCDLLYGQIGILGLENVSIFEKFIKLFYSCDRDKVDCALMTIGDYGQITSDNNYQLGSYYSKYAWINLFHLSQSNSKSINKTKNVIVNLLNKLDYVDNNELSNIINEYLRKCEENNTFTWNYYYIKYSEFRPGKYGKYHWKNNINREKNLYDFKVMWTERHLSENAYNPFLKAIDINKQLARESYGDRIIMDKVYIESTNNRYVYRSVETGKECGDITIEQDDNGVDKEDRILKFYIKNGINKK